MIGFLSRVGIWKLGSEGKRVVSGMDSICVSNSNIPNGK